MAARLQSSAFAQGRSGCAARGSRNFPVVRCSSRSGGRSPSLPFVADRYKRRLSPSAGRTFRPQNPFVSGVARFLLRTRHDRALRYVACANRRHVGHNPRPRSVGKSVACPRSMPPGSGSILLSVRWYCVHLHARALLLRTTATAARSICVGLARHSCVRPSKDIHGSTRRHRGRNGRSDC
jgi:hypothetical protein